MAWTVRYDTRKAYFSDLMQPESICQQSLSHNIQAKREVKRLEWPAERCYKLSVTEYAKLHKWLFSNNETTEKVYLSWPNSHKRETSSQLKGAEVFSVTVCIAWLAGKDPLCIDDWPELICDSHNWTRIETMRNFTDKVGSGPLSLDISSVISLTSKPAFGVYKIWRVNQHA